MTTFNNIFTPPVCYVHFQNRVKFSPEAHDIYIERRPVMTHEDKEGLSYLGGKYNV